MNWGWGSRAFDEGAEAYRDVAELVGTVVCADAGWIVPADEVEAEFAARRAKTLRKLDGMKS